MTEPDFEFECSRKVARKYRRTIRKLSRSTRLPGPSSRTQGGTGERGANEKCRARKIRVQLRATERLELGAQGIDTEQESLEGARRKEDLRNRRAIAGSQEVAQPLDPNNHPSYELITWLTSILPHVWLRDYALEVIRALCPYGTKEPEAIWHEAITAEKVKIRIDKLMELIHEVTTDVAQRFCDRQLRTDNIPVDNMTLATVFSHFNNIAAEVLEWAKKQGHSCSVVVWSKVAKDSKYRITRTLRTLQRPAWAHMAAIMAQERGLIRDALEKEFVRFETAMAHRDMARIAAQVAGPTDMPRRGGQAQTLPQQGGSQVKGPPPNMPRPQERLESYPGPNAPNRNGWLRKNFCRKTALGKPCTRQDCRFVHNPSDVRLNMDVIRAVMQGDS